MDESPRECDQRRPLVGYPAPRMPGQAAQTGGEGLAPRAHGRTVQRGGRSYTTPTYWQFCRMLREHRRMYRKSQESDESTRR